MNVNAKVVKSMTPKQSSVLARISAYNLGVSRRQIMSVYTVLANATHELEL